MPITVGAYGAHDEVLLCADVGLGDVDTERPWAERGIQLPWNPGGTRWSSRACAAM